MLENFQVLQNKCLRIITNSDYKTPTSDLLHQTKSLSVHQQMAHLSLSQVYNIHRTQLPAYHYGRLFGNNQDEPRIRSGNNYPVNRIEFTLSQARTHFFLPILSSLGCPTWPSQVFQKQINLQEKLQELGQAQHYGETLVCIFI